ncbi:unnamed protein product [Hermetia illucens]|uniref:Uncharacterized protein n=1 Tax=Hermetia illucens TaxID=343691 RepID=A0A7R8UBR0_HERIL|nr:BUD13 homolog isoform X1 [Hermetia illucens]CAD7077626.1 unnamed protein product [Hermetia illucens]
MANIDQKKYLKKYLDDDQTKHRKKKRRDRSRSYPERVKIVDDDVDFKRSKRYDDDDFILTGEDAPQIVGVVDDRPPELKAVEDFRNNSKWKSLGNSGDRSSHNDGRYQGPSHRYAERKRSRSPVKRDYSPPRRPDYGSRKPRTSADYSPIRRRRDEDSRQRDDNSRQRDRNSGQRDRNSRQRDGDSRQREGDYRARDGDYRSRDRDSRQRDGDSRQREANYYKSEKTTTYSEDAYARRRDEYVRAPKGDNYGHYRQPETSHKDGHDNHRPASYTRPHYSPPPAGRAQHDSRRNEYASENGRSADYHSKPSHHKDDYARGSRQDPNKFNPFRGNLSPTHSTAQPREDHTRRQSPGRSNNPFRSNPGPTSLSPLPDKRGEGSRAARPQKTNDGRGFKPDFGRNSNSFQSDMGGKGSFNPFRVEKNPEEPIPPTARASAINSTKGGRPETAQPAYRPAPDRIAPPRGNYYPGFDKKQENISQDPRAYRRSRSPIKSGIQVVNPQPLRADKPIRYQPDSRDRAMDRFGGTGYPPQKTYMPRRHPASQVSNFKY